MPPTDATLLIAATDAGWHDHPVDLLSDCGFAVETARDGLGCLAKLRACEPDVLVIELDILWGGGDGVIANLKQGLGLSRTPAIFLLGNLSRELLAAWVDLPRSHCYQKSFPLMDLKDAVCREFGLLGARRERSDCGSSGAVAVVELRVLSSGGRHVDARGETSMVLHA